MRKIILIGGLLALALSACGQSDSSATQPTTAPPTAAPLATSTAAPPSSATAAAYPAPSAATAAAYPAPRNTATPALPLDALQATARDKLARYLSVSADKVLLQSADHKDWPDGSLGCPQAGMAYPQIVTPGSLLVFVVEKSVYEVHTGRSDGQLILCQNKLPVDLNAASSQPQSPTSAAAPSAAAQSPADSARQALADALGIKLADVTVVATEAMVWKDSSMGCPKPNLNYMQVITPGYKLTLEAGGKRYEYHTDRGHNVVRCDKA